MVSSGKWVQLFYMLEIFHNKMLERNEQQRTASDPLLLYTGKGDWEPGSGRVRILQVSPSSWGHYGGQRPWAAACSSGSCKRRQNSACPDGDRNMFLKTGQTNLNPSRNEGRWEIKAWGRGGAPQARMHPQDKSQTRTHCFDPAPWGSMDDFLDSVKSYQPSDTE